MQELRRRFFIAGKDQKLVLQGKNGCSFGGLMVKYYTRKALRKV